MAKRNMETGASTILRLVDPAKRDGGVAPANPTVEWLLHEGWTVTDPTELIERLAASLVAEGIPLSRLLVFLKSLHPQIAGVKYTWRRETGRVKTWSASHSALQTAVYQDSPVAAIIEDSVGSIRRQLDIRHPKLDYPILQKLLAEGMTDYLAIPMVFSDGEISAITFATDKDGGFSAYEVKQISDLTRVLARLLEAHAVRRTAKNLLNTYLGKHTGERVLRGLIKRGDSEDINAVIWFCDLRDSTAMADSMPRTAFLGILNDFFDSVAGPVLDHGGEVLRFIGDAALAIFPTGTSSSGIDRGCCDVVSACHAALAAAKDAQARIRALNDKRARKSEPPLRFGLALHMGEVTYGNIGVPQRLEFTVIGAAANKAARLESLCKILDQPVLISSDFKRCFPEELVSLGFHSLRGVGAHQEIFTLPAD